LIQNKNHKTKLNIVVTNNFCLKDEKILINEMNKGLNPLKNEIEIVNKRKLGKNDKKDLIINYSDICA
jgi:hypothetical protein